MLVVFLELNAQLVQMPVSQVHVGKGDCRREPHVSHVTDHGLSGKLATFHLVIEFVFVGHSTIGELDNSLSDEIV